MKPILVGMNNPLSSRPEHALWPEPVGCTGWRIWRMLNVACDATPEEYTETFERMNLLNARVWNREEAAEAALGLWEKWQGREVALLGDEVYYALGLPRVPKILPQEYNGVRFRRVPHPSGRSHWYNNMVNREMVGLLLEDMFVRARR